MFSRFAFSLHARLYVRWKQTRLGVRSGIYDVYTPPFFDWPSLYSREPERGNETKGRIRQMEQLVRSQDGKKSEKV